MLTNEQRAHDLSITMVQYFMRNDVIPTGCEPDENGRINKDIFKLYVDTYRSLLKSMAREFPEQP